MGFLKFTRAITRPANAVQNFISQHRFRILKFAPGRVHYTYIAQNFISQREFEILKLIHEPLRAPRRVLPSADIAEAGRAARLTSQHTYDAVEKRRAVRLNQYLNSVWRRIALRSAATRHGYKTARAENFSKFDLTGALLNFKSRFAMQLCSAVTRRNYEAWRSEIYAVCLHKYPALIRAASGKISRYEVGQATNASLSRGMQRMKFYALNRHAIKFLKFLGARRFGLQAAVGRGFKILKFGAAEPLKCRLELQKQMTELLKFARFARHEFKLKFAVVLKFIWNFMLNFTLNFTRNSASQVCAVCSNIQNSTPHAYAAYLNPRNSVLQARAAEFENGVKFKGAVKFERSARRIR